MQSHRSASMASSLPSSILFVLFVVAWPPPADALRAGQGWKRRAVVSTALLLPAPALAQQAQEPQPSVISTNKKRSVCRIELPNRARYDASGDSLLRSAGCAHVGMAHGRGTPQIYASDAHVHATAPLSSFTADFVVPPLPARRTPPGSTWTRPRAARAAAPAGRRRRARVRGPRGAAPRAAPRPRPARPWAQGGSSAHSPRCSGSHGARAFTYAAHAGTRPHACNAI